MTEFEEPEVPGPEDERQQLNHLIDRLRLFATQAQEKVVGNPSPDLFTGSSLQMLVDDLTQAANWLDSLVVQLEDGIPD
ncbi:MAG: hypothetical protein IVW52_16035 [Acidimicrobiales bacterium]|nr:hypothetical protein [Acidimicrobiales bacterium]